MKYLVLLLLSGCASLPTSVVVSDHTFYYLKQASEEQYATQIQFLTTAVQDLSLTQWTAILTGNDKPLCMALTDWSNINQMISDFCSAPSINCDYQVSPGTSFRQLWNGFFDRLTVASGVRFRKI